MNGKSVFIIRPQIIGLVAVLVTVAGVQADDWPQWRGPGRSNASRETGLLQSWPTNGPPLVWRATGIGLGIQSVSVAGGRVFTVGNREGGEFLFALDARTGEKLWATRLDDAIEENPLMRWLTQRSPTVDGDQLYTLTASGELWCVRVGDGQKIWKKSYPKDFAATRPVWGFCDFPLVDDRLYLMEGGAPVCVDAKTGLRAWANHSTNQLIRAALTWADGHLYIRNAQGQVTLGKASPEGIAEQGRFEIPEHEQSLGVTAPVVANGRLWLRDNNRLFCYDVSQSALKANRPAPDHVAIGLTDRELGIEPDTPRPPRVGVNRAPDAVFVPTPHDIVERMLQEASVKKTDLVVDLGSGDGRVVIAAAKEFGCKAVGYEIDARLVQQSREAVARENLGSLASIEHKDIFTLDLSGGDVITVFLYPRLMERLIPQFEHLKPGSRIISHQFEMPGVKPDKTLVIESKEDGDKHRIFLWTTPLKN